MLSLKYLNGDHAGETVKLKNGENSIGRLAESDISISSSGVSKKHAKITVQGDQCLLKDLGSSNGTFVNGTKISDRILRLGDKIAFHNVIFELTVEKQTAPKKENTQSPFSNLAVQQNFQPQPFSVSLPQPQTIAPPKNLSDALRSYAQNVIMPGVYKLVEIYPLRNVMALFLLIYIIMVTFLSTIPMVEMTKIGIQKEAQRRALTIARQLASVSEKALATGTEAGIPDLSQSEDGITLSVLVAKQDGHLIAPLSKAQSYSNEEFVARGRKHDETFVQQISDTSIGVSIPVHVFSQEAGTQVIAAYAQVIYKMDSFQWDESIGLLARVLIIAILIGTLVYIMLYRVLVHPIEEAAGQLDEALRGERDTIVSKYDFDVLNKFIENINGALGRLSHQPEGGAVIIDRAGEASNLVRILNDAAFALDGEGRFLQINAAFEDLTGMRLLTLQGQSLEALQDQALKLNLEDLLQKARQKPGSMTSAQLDISGISYDIDMQASPEGQGIGYFLGTLKRGGIA